jgi:hypothetical protein
MADADFSMPVAEMVSSAAQPKPVRRGFRAKRRERCAITSRLPPFYGPRIQLFTSSAGHLVSRTHSAVSSAFGAKWPATFCPTRPRAGLSDVLSCGAITSSKYPSIGTMARTAASVRRDSTNMVRRCGFAKWLAGR